MQGTDNPGVTALMSVPRDQFARVAKIIDAQPSDRHA